jgi:hypothetical protein
MEESSMHITEWRKTGFQNATYCVIPTTQHARNSEVIGTMINGYQRLQGKEEG